MIHINKKADNKRFNRLQLGIIISALTIILVATYLFFRLPLHQKTLSPTASTAKQLQQVYINADSAASNGDYAKGQAILDEALKSKVSDSDLSRIYIQKAVLASNNSRPGDAVAFATKAEALDPTRVSAMTLALMAEHAKDTTLALKYYRLTAERTTERDKQLSPGDFEDLQAKIKVLSES